jgi:hypothetical protein
MKAKELINNLNNYYCFLKSLEAIKISKKLNSFDMSLEEEFQVKDMISDAINFGMDIKERYLVE